MRTLFTASPSTPARRAVPRNSRRSRPEVAPLEGRTLMSVGASASAAEPSAVEQYMLQLVNRARANPQAEGQRLLDIARTDKTLAPALVGWDASAFLRAINASAASPPLAINTRLVAAARAHDGAMVAANSQYHTDLSSLGRPTDASQAAPDGQPVLSTENARWSAAENVFAYSANLPDAHGKPLADYFHEGFLLDWGNPEFGHLKNLFLPGPTGAAAAGTTALNEIGIGILTDARPTAAATATPAISTNQGLNVGPALVTQEFAWRSNHQYLTGAFYADRDADHFYTPGEGLGGVTIVATSSTGAVYSTTTWGSGGYSLDLPEGTYQVTASGGGLATPRTTAFALGKDNVGWDVSDDAPSPPTTSIPVATPPATTPTRPTTPAWTPTKTVAIPQTGKVNQHRKVKLTKRQQRILQIMQRNAIRARLAAQKTG